MKNCLTAKELDNLHRIAELLSLLDAAWDKYAQDLYLNPWRFNLSLPKELADLRAEMRALCGG